MVGQGHIVQQLTMLNTAATSSTQVLGKKKRKDSECDSLSCRSHRRRISDGLMVQYINGDHRIVKSLIVRFL